MKKFGFTLAEILVTLGVIGIVAALTVPQLVQNINKAHIGPTLQRVVSTIETANIDILRENGVDDLQTIAQTPEEYFRLLAQKIPSSSTKLENSLIERSLYQIMLNTGINPVIEEFGLTSESLVLIKALISHLILISCIGGIKMGIIKEHTAVLELI